eukprot:COSAG02_NODE_32291_length_518_cov_2.391408_1_plen_94_part_01
MLAAAFLVLALLCAALNEVLFRCIVKDGRASHAARQQLAHRRWHDATYAHVRAIRHHRILAVLRKAASASDPMVVQGPGQDGAEEGIPASACMP